MPDGRGWSTSIISFLLGAILVAILFSLFFTQMCCPPPQNPAAKLVIEDDHSGVWMAVDNGFTEGTIAAGTSWAKRIGILIQLGTFWEYLDDTQPWTYQPYMESGTVTLTGDVGTPLVLSANDFTWLNIVGDKAGAPAEPITAADAGLFFEDPNTPTGCLECDPNLPPPDPWQCDHPITTLPLSCLRNRSLHAHFRARRIITYWQGEKGYSAKAEQVANEHDGVFRCNRYTFNLLDPVTVTAWQGDARATSVNDEIALRGKIVSITVSAHQEVDHDEAHDPPTIRR